MKFITNETNDGPVKVTVSIDEDGDAELKLDGIAVAYIDHDTGTLCCYVLSSAHRVTLAAKGIDIDTDGEIVVD